MSLSLTNRDDIIANSYSLITSTGSVVNILDAVQSSVVGLPPATLNTLEKLSAAISDDPTYFTTMQNAINAKVNTTTLTTTVETLNASIAGKQGKFIVSDIPANTGRLFDSNSTKFRGINVASPLSIATPGFEYLTISCDSYTKLETDGKVSALVGAAPELLNTLVELSAALGNDQNYATTITNALNAKAPKESPALTGTATAAALTVSGALLVGTTNVLTALGEKATTTNLDLKAPLNNPALTGTATATNLTVNGALLIGTTNVLTSLGEKATTTNLDLKAPLSNPALTGTATAANLTVNGALLIGTTNVSTALNDKATIANLDLRAPKASPAFTGTATAVDLTVSGTLLAGTTNVGTGGLPQPKTGVPETNQKIK